MTSIIEPKATCDDQGNWTKVHMVRVRSGKGWIETPVPEPSDRAGERKAA